MDILTDVSTNSTSSSNASDSSNILELRSDKSLCTDPDIEAKKLLPVCGEHGCTNEAKLTCYWKTSDKCLVNLCTDHKSLIRKNTGNTRYICKSCQEYSYPKQCCLIGCICYDPVFTFFIVLLLSICFLFIATSVLPI